MSQSDTDPSQGKTTRQQEDELIYRQASLIGIVTGFRATLPLTLLTWSQDNEAEDEDEHSQRKTISAIATVGEMVASRILSRTSEGRKFNNKLILGRLGMGALAGALLCRRSGRPMLPGALRGALGAGVGALAAYACESILPELTDMPHFVWNSIEDGIALWLGNTVLQHHEENQPS